MRKVIVFGGSAGGIRGLCSILGDIPSDIPAALLAVIHTSEQSGLLTQVLGRCGALKTLSPATAEPLCTGCLYVAAPNRHLIVRSHCAVSWMGPRENRHRPAVDALFRSAARSYRSQVVAVVLSGALDDGSAGALAVKARGGTVIVQDPADAQVAGMPANVLRQVKADHCVPLEKIPELLVQLAAQGRAIKTGKRPVKDCEAAVPGPGAARREALAFSCPDCGGALTELHDGKSVQFRCHVGHTFSLESFSEAHADALERALWTALRQLNEQRGIQQHLARVQTDTKIKKRYQENVTAAEHDMRLLHEILARL